MLGSGIEAFDQYVKEHADYKIELFDKSLPPKNIAEQIVWLHEKFELYHDRLKGIYDTKLPTKITNKDISDYVKLPYMFFVMYDEDKVIGYNRLILGEKYIKISELWVEETYRGQKLGTKLIHKVEALAKDRQRKIVSMHAISANVGAIKLYKSLGYNTYIGGYIVQRDPKSSTKVPNEIPSTELHYFKNEYIEINSMYDIYTYKENENRWNRFISNPLYLVELSTGHVAILKSVDSKQYGKFAYCVHVKHPDEDGLITSRSAITEICSQLYKWKNTKNMNDIYIDVINIDTKIADTLSFLECDGYGLYKRI